MYSVFIMLEHLLKQITKKKKKYNLPFCQCVPSLTITFSMSMLLSTNTITIAYINFIILLGKYVLQILILKVFF